MVVYWACRVSVWEASLKPILEVTPVGQLGLGGVQYTTCL